MGSARNSRIDRLRRKVEYEEVIICEARDKAVRELELNLSILEDWGLLNEHEKYLLIMLKDHPALHPSRRPMRGDL